MKKFLTLLMIGSLLIINNNKADFIETYDIIEEDDEYVEEIIDVEDDLSSDYYDEEVIVEEIIEEPVHICKPKKQRIVKKVYYNDPIANFFCAATGFIMGNAIGRAISDN